VQGFQVHVGELIALGGSHVLLPCCSGSPALALLPCCCCPSLPPSPPSPSPAAAGVPAALQALSYCDEDFMIQLQGPHLDKAEAITFPIHLNMAAAHLKLQDWPAAAHSCTQVCGGWIGWCWMGGGGAWRV
jgi:hypothetical protein